MSAVDNALSPPRAAPPNALFPGLKPAKLLALLKYLAFFVSANALSSVLVSLARLGSGGFVVSPKGKRPEKRLQLYEWQGCPFCRNVREAISALDLEVDVYPTPRETIKAYGVVSAASRYRPKVMEIGGKAQFPFLVDPNTGKQLYESGDIMAYLYDTYGPGPSNPDRLPWILRKGMQHKYLAFALPSIARLVSFQGIETGVLRCPSELPAKPLELWTSEWNPMGRMVKEALTSLELPYTWTPTAWGSDHKAPGGWGLYLRDPNSGFESGFWVSITNCGFLRSDR